MLNKKALTLNDVSDFVGQATVNPLVRAGLLGTAGYFGSKYLYGHAADAMAMPNINAIQDPQQHQYALQQYLQRKNKMQGYVSAAGALAGAALPLAGASGPFNEAWKKFSANDPGTYSNLATPFLNNRDAAYEQLGKVPNIDKQSDESYSTIHPYSDVNANDMAIGKDFIMPAILPLNFLDDPLIPKRSSIDLMLTQRPIIGHNATTLLTNGLEAAGNKDSGMISTTDIMHGLVNAGIGAGAGWGLGRLLGTIFAQPAETKAKMSYYGAIGGAILNSGLIGGILNRPQ